MNLAGYFQGFIKYVIFRMTFNVYKRKGAR